MMSRCKNINCSATSLKNDDRCYRCKSFVDNQTDKNNLVEWERMERISDGECIPTCDKVPMCKKPIYIYKKNKAYIRDISLCNKHYQYHRRHGGKRFFCQTPNCLNHPSNHYPMCVEHYMNEAMDLVRIDATTFEYKQSIYKEVILYTNYRQHSTVPSRPAVATLTSAGGNHSKNLYGGRGNFQC